MELGSEFSMVTVGSKCEDNIFHLLQKFDTQYTDSGRSALRLLLKLLPMGKVLLPAYICQSVYQCFQPYQISFYELTRNLEIDWYSLFSQLDEDVSIVYLHYFNGVLPHGAMLQRLQNAQKEFCFQIIEDTTHSIFSAALTIGDYCVCSLRKWFPIPDGGVLYGSALKGLRTKGEAPWVQNKIQAMRKKQTYLSGQGDESHKIEYRKMFAECNYSLYKQGDCYHMSAASKEILENNSISQLIVSRKRNAAQIMEALKKEFSWLQPLAWTCGDECPLTLPVRTENRDALRAYLISQNIYCAVHWPLQGTPMEATNAASVSKYELSLPIDQRYGAAEMEYIVNCLRHFRRMDIC